MAGPRRWLIAPALSAAVALVAYRRGAFFAPLVFQCRDPHGARAVHEVEAFGPVATLVPYRDASDAIALARRSGGSLVASVFSGDDAAASDSSNFRGLGRR